MRKQVIIQLLSHLQSTTLKYSKIGTLLQSILSNCYNDFFVITMISWLMMLNNQDWHFIYASSGQFIKLYIFDMTTWQVIFFDMIKSGHGTSPQANNVGVKINLNFKHPSRG